MKELGKRLSEVEYILKYMDISYIEKLPDKVIDYISKNKDDEYSIGLSNSLLLSNVELNADTVAILTYINMNYFMESNEKDDIKLLLKKAEADFKNRKEQ